MHKTKNRKDHVGKRIVKGNAHKKGSLEVQLGKVRTGRKRMGAKKKI